MLALTGSTASAGPDDDEGPPPTLPCEGCDGNNEVTEIESCEKQFGEGSKAVFDADTGDFKWCATALPPPPPPLPPPLPPGSGDDCKDSPRGCGGNPPPPDDECADNDNECICAMEEPEEPEICALSCGECDASKAQCNYEVEAQNNECQSNNTTIAAQMCNLYGGLQMPYGRGYADVPSCIKGRTQGFPGISIGESTTNTEGWSVSVSGGLKFEPLGVGGSTGGNFTTSGLATDGTQHTTTYPPVPVDLSIFDDCISEAGAEFAACGEMDDLCKTYVSETTGESCRATSRPDADAAPGAVSAPDTAAADNGSQKASSPFVTFDPDSATLSVYGPVVEEGRVVFRRTTTVLQAPQLILRNR